MERRRPLTIAHRGAHSDYPENSLPAILQALDLGAQGVEIDVHATSDGILVVHHDPDLRGGGLIRELPASEVTAVELAPGIPVPLLDDVLDAVAGRAILFIESKAQGVELALIRAVRRSPAESAVHSFHHPTIANLKKTMPALRAGILTEGNAANVLDAIRATNADDIWHKTREVDGALVSACHRLGKQVIAWTANSKKECARLIELGVDGICTDDVGLLG